MAFRVKRLAQARERSHPLGLEQREQIPLDRLKSLDPGGRRSAGLLKSPVEAVRQIQQLQDDVAFATLGDTSALALDTLPEVVKNGERSKAHVALTAHFPRSCSFSDRPSVPGAW